MLALYRLTYMVKNISSVKSSRGVLIPTNPLLTTPLTARVTFEIFKNHITLKGSGYPPITVIRAFLSW